MSYIYISSSKSPSGGSSTTPYSTTTTIGCNTVTGTTLVVFSVINDGTTARAGGAPTYNGAPMLPVTMPWFPYSASSDESNIEMWYVTNPLPGNVRIVVPRTAGSFFTSTCWASCSFGSSSIYLTSSYNNNNIATASITMTTAPPSGGIFYVGLAGDGDNNAATAYSQRLIQTTDIGNWNWAVQIASQSSAASINFRYDYRAETWSTVVAAFGEHRLDTHFIITGDDTPY